MKEKLAASMEELAASEGELKARENELTAVTLERDELSREFDTTNEEWVNLQSQLEHIRNSSRVREHKLSEEKSKALDKSMVLQQVRALCNYQHGSTSIFSCVQELAQLQSNLETASAKFNKEKMSAEKLRSELKHSQAEAEAFKKEAEKTSTKFSKEKMSAEKLHSDLKHSQAEAEAFKKDALATKSELLKLEKAMARVRFEAEDTVKTVVGNMRYVDERNKLL